MMVFKHSNRCPTHPVLEIATWHNKCHDRPVLEMVCNQPDRCSVRETTAANRQNKCPETRMHSRTNKETNMPILAPNNPQALEMRLLNRSNRCPMSETI